jgi:hypothetical protein
MIYYGFDEVLQGWDRYFDLCNLFEVRPPTESEHQSIKTLNRWRVDSPKGFAWVLHAEPGCADGLVEAYQGNSTELPSTIAAAMAATEERAAALAAKAIVLETPPELPPSDTSRALLAAFGEQWKTVSKRPVIWESSGLWTVEDGRAIAAEAGFVYVVDPFMIDRDGGDLGRGGDAAFRITERAAARRQFDSWEMEQLIDWAEPFDRTFVLLAGRYKVPHAKELHVLTSRT